MNWNQPICAVCYSNRYPGRNPVRITDAEAEQCCQCGEETRAGIYYRVDPRTVPHPTEKKS